jgi:GrpB-like predicted nucleotidyltransferase (UPF0157 family)
MSLPNDYIEIADYDPSWPAMADAEISFLKTIVCLEGSEFEHIGSTAIPGISAKPIIDLMLGVNSLDDARLAIQPLENVGYSYWRDNPFKEHFFFVKGLPLVEGPRRTHHVHLIRKNSDFWRSQILFRDYLRQHWVDALKYQQLKIRLADRFREDRDGYTNAKTEFVNAILLKATALGVPPPHGVH